MTSREQFEEVAANKLNFSVSTVIASRSGESYDSTILDTWWYFWKASREALEVVLPQRQSLCASGYGNGYFVACNDGDGLEYDDVVEAIRDAGIKVKGD